MGQKQLNRTLVGAILISLCLHSLLLALMPRDQRHTPVPETGVLTVSFATPKPMLPNLTEKTPVEAIPVVQTKTTPPLPNTPAHINEAAPLHHDDAVASPSTATTPISAVASQPAPLDMGSILSQARQYAQQETKRQSPEKPNIYGNYYGEFKGDDYGEVSFTIEPSGRVFGSGKSARFDVMFLIMGQVTSEGVLFSEASGKAGEAALTGRINLSTGEVSGYWRFVRFKGTFVARHE